MNIINEWYAKDTSKKIRAVMKSKVEAGEHLCTNPPYSYMKAPDNNKRWVVDEAAAEIVKRIFALCLKGYGPSQIARILKEEKVITPTIHFQRTGKATRSTPPDNPYHWTGDTVADIFRASRVSRVYSKLQDLQAVIQKQKDLLQSQSKVACV